MVMIVALDMKSLVCGAAGRCVCIRRTPNSSGSFSVGSSFRFLMGPLSQAGSRSLPIQSSAHSAADSIEQRSEALDDKAFGPDRRTLQPLKAVLSDRSQDIVVRHARVRRTFSFSGY